MRSRIIKQILCKGVINLMAFDFKKEYKEYYMPKNKPQIVNIPEMNYIAVHGEGDPDKASGKKGRII